MIETSGLVGMFYAVGLSCIFYGGKSHHYRRFCESIWGLEDYIEKSVGFVAALTLNQSGIPGIPEVAEIHLAALVLEVAEIHQAAQVLEMAEISHPHHI